MMAVERILSRLSGVRRIRDDRWTAQCPAHDDHSPSLSIRQADDRVLLRCWAGCRVENICTALGIALADLYDDARHSRPDTVAHRRRLAAEGLEKWRQTQLQRCAEELRQHDELIRRVDAAVRDSAVTEDEAWDQLEAAYRGYSELEYRFERLLQNQDVLQIWRESTGGSHEVARH